MHWAGLWKRQLDCLAHELELVWRRIQRQEFRKRRIPIHGNSAERSELDPDYLGVAVSWLNDAKNNTKEVR
jgi:hypothetical protein